MGVPICNDEYCKYDVFPYNIPPTNTLTDNEIKSKGFSGFPVSGLGGFEDCWQVKSRGQVSQPPNTRLQIRIIRGSDSSDVRNVFEYYTRATNKVSRNQHGHTDI